MTDAWPDNLPHGVIDFEPIGGARNGGSAGGLTPAMGPTSGGPHWRATVSQLPLHTQAQILAARAMEGFLDGGAGSVFVPACDGRLRPAVTSAAFATAYARGTDEIELDYVGETLVGGVQFSAIHTDESVGRRMYRLVEDLGAGVWRITPFLRAAVDATTVIDFADPSCPMRLESGFDLPIELGRFGAVEATFVEYFDRSPAPEITEPGEPPTDPARYRRFRALHTHDGDTLFSPAEAGFLDGWAGSTISGTPLSSTPSAGTVAVNAFDAAPLTYVSLAGSGGWIGQDNGAPIARPTEGYLTARTSTGYDQMPSDLVYEESQDGVTWETVKTWTGLSPWVSNETRYFDILDRADATWDGAVPAQWRKQRIRALTVGAGPYFGLAEFKFLDVLGGSTTISSGIAYKGWNVISGEVFNLTDGNNLTTCAVQLSNGSWFWADHGLTPRDEIVQLYLQSQYFNPEQAPLTFVLEGSNWAGEWENIASFTTTAWGRVEARRFDI